MSTGNIYGDLRRKFGMEQQTGAAAPNFKSGIYVNGSLLSSTETGYLDGVTAGTVTASKAVVVDSNKDVGDLRNLDCANLDAGASGTAGSVDVFPATASRGKLAITCANQTGNTTVTLNANAMGQATTVNIPDPGASAGYVVLSTAAVSLTEADTLQGAVGTTKAGRATADAAAAAANAVVIVTGLSSVTAQIVQILRAGNDVTVDADVTVSGGSITVADGSTYNVTDGDVINWIAVGAM